MTSRLSLMRRLDSLSRERRSRSASFFALNSSAGFNSPPWLDCGRHSPASSRGRLDAATGFEKDTGLAGTDRIVWSEKSQDCRHKQHKRHASATHLACRMF